MGVCWCYGMWNGERGGLWHCGFILLWFIGLWYYCVWHYAVRVCKFNGIMVYVYIVLCVRVYGISDHDIMVFV